MFIGYYSIANAVTLFGLISAVTSCFLAANGNIKFAVYMMFLACICDMFDGRIARMKKKRSENAKYYGVQLDSLCDMVSFGVTPCFIAYSFGFDGVLDIIIYCIVIACGAIRLAYFNTIAYASPEKAKKGFRGIPIPMSTFIVTFLFMLTTLIPAGVMVWFFRIFYLGLAVSFILNIRVRKPDIKKGLILIAIEIVMLLVLLIAGDCKAPEGASNTQAETEVSDTSEISE